MLLFALLEIQRQLAYPKNFIVRLTLPVFFKVLAVHLLWKVIVNSGAEWIDSNNILKYSVLAPVFYLLLRPEPAFIMREVYDGTIQRYFTYPKNFFAIIFFRHIGYLLTRVLEFLLMLLITLYFFNHTLSLNNFLSFLILGSVASINLFLIFASLELITLTLEEGWSLSLILDRLIFLCSGVIMPLHFFPEQFQTFLYFTPFPYLVYLPVSAFLEGISIEKGIKCFVAGLAWMVIFIFTSSFLYKIGRERFTAYGT